MTDGVYWESLDGSATTSTVTEKDSTETQTDSVSTLTDATDQVWEIYFDGSSVYFFAAGTQSSTIHPANIPDDEALTLSLAVLTGEATANTVNVKWLRAIQIGR